VQVADQDDGGRRRTAGGISLQTLLIASVASAVTSYVVSRVWGAGTLIGAAATPVIVALVAESLRKPVETVAATAQRVPVDRYVPVVRERVRVQPDPDAPTRVAGIEDDAPTRIVGEPRPREPRLPREGRRGPATPPPVDPGYVAALEAEPVSVRPAQRARIRWGLVLATAAAAFTIVVAIYTIPDLVAGKSITGSGRSTTLFGGSRSSSSPSTSTTKDDTTTTKTGTTDATKTVTTTAPATTTTVPAPTTTAPAPTTAAPAPTTTAPPAATTPGTTAPVTPTTPPAAGTTTPATP
jgi:hypothetical protein